MNCDDALRYAESQGQEFLRKWLDLLRFETISAQTDHANDIRRAADWLRQLFEEIRINAEVLETQGHPAVFADTGPVPGNGLTALIYGHYDVQPPGDLALWRSPPFAPEIRDGRVFARGSCDDKGLMLTHVLAAACWKHTAGRLPIRLKFLIEGEEEIGSPHLAEFVRQQKDRLACDHVLISDTGKFDATTPAITYGTKGLVYKEILLTGPIKDLHSGSFGGTVANPANALASIIASLKDAQGRVTIPTFYDDVRPLDEKEKALLAALPFDEKAYLAEVGSPSAEGEVGFSTLERRWARPTLDVNGIFGGYMGEGASTIIPAKAGAKVSVRLVPDQECGRISDAFDAAVRSACPRGVRLEIKNHGLCNAYVAPIDSKVMEAAAKAIEAGFGRKPVFIREGGTLPILPMFKAVLGADSLMLGYADPNSNIHSPNEWLAEDDFYGGIRSNIGLLGALAEL